MSGRPSRAQSSPDICIIGIKHSRHRTVLFLISSCDEVCWFKVTRRRCNHKEMFEICEELARITDIVQKIIQEDGNRDKRVIEDQIGMIIRLHQKVLLAIDESERCFISRKVEVLDKPLFNHLIYFNNLASNTKKELIKMVSESRDRFWEISTSWLIQKGPPVFKLDVHYGQVANVNSKCYKMESIPRGRVVIYNITNIRGSDRREGNEYDVANVENIFLRMGFVVKIIVDCAAEEFRNSLKEECSHEDLKELDSFVIFIMTHGISGRILIMRDGGEVNMLEVEDILGGNRSPLLFQKPKLVFVQSCRGVTGNGCAQFDTEYGSLCPSYDAKRYEDVRPQLMSDIFVSYSTYEGSKAARLPGKGSWYIRALVLVLAMHACSLSYSDIMNEVHRLVGLQKADCFIQIPQKQDSGRFSLYLHPIEVPSLLEEAERLF